MELKNAAEIHSFAESLENGGGLRDECNDYSLGMLPVNRAFDRGYLHNQRKFACGIGVAYRRR